MAEETTAQERAQRIYAWAQDTQLHPDSLVGGIVEELEAAHADGVRQGLEEACRIITKYSENCQRGPGCERCALVRWMSEDIRARLAEKGG